MKIMIALIIFFIILSVSVSAFTMSSDRYKIEGVISDGGGRLSGGSYVAYVAVGQPVIGNLANSPYKLCLGAFCTRMFETPHYVTLSGTLKYDTNVPLANSDAKVAVTYGLGRWETRTKTDADGKFSAKVSVPEYVTKSKFHIEVYAKGRVEAMYECTYDTALQTCK